jgi:transcriptional regulator with XRE-family HTH domain
VWIAPTGVSRHSLRLTDMKSESASSSEMQRLGLTLRALRLKRKWTLKEFERASGFEIKDVVLGSYERGSRAISVAKLVLIAAVYEVPISAFFDENPTSNVTKNSRNLIIDLRKLREIANSDCSESICLLNRYVHGIVSVRRDWNGEIISLRNSDLTYLSILTSQSFTQIIEEFRTSNLLFNLKD